MLWYSSKDNWFLRWGGWHLLFSMETSWQKGSKNWSLPSEGAIKLFIDEIKVLKQHIFIKRHQHAAYNQLKESWKLVNFYCMLTIVKTTPTSNKTKSKVRTSATTVFLSSQHAVISVMLEGSWSMKTLWLFQRQVITQKSPPFLVLAMFFSLWDTTFH